MRWEVYAADSECESSHKYLSSYCLCVAKEQNLTVHCLKQRQQFTSKMAISAQGIASARR
jgi:hypothetical protein